MKNRGLAVVLYALCSGLAESQVVVWESLQSAGSNLCVAGRVYDGIVVVEKAMEVAAKLDEGSAEKTAASMDLMTDLYIRSGSYDAAERICRQALEIRMTNNGQVSSPVEVSQRKLGIVYEQMDQLTNAERYYSEALTTALCLDCLDEPALRTNWIGLMNRKKPASPSVIEGFENLARTKAKLGKTDVASGINRVAQVLKRKHAEADVVQRNADARTRGGEVAGAEGAMRMWRQQESQTGDDHRRAMERAELELLQMRREALANEDRARKEALFQQQMRDMEVERANRAREQAVAQQQMIQVIQDIGQKMNNAVVPPPVYPTYEINTRMPVLPGSPMTPGSPLNPYIVQPRP